MGAAAVAKRRKAGGSLILPARKSVRRPRPPRTRPRKRQYVVEYKGAVRRIAGYDLKAGEKATRLLFSFLTATQRRSLQQYEHFIVVGSSGRRYRVGYGLEEVGRRWGNMCMHQDYGQIPGQIPHADLMLTKLIMLQIDDIGFLRSMGY